MFPAGTAGISLLLLRVSVVATLLVDEAAYEPWSAPFRAFALVSLTGIFLFVGFLTPYVCLVACLFQLPVLLNATGLTAFHLTVSMLNSAILAVLGPGAYSVDARVFGRRVLTLPPGR